MQNRDNISQLHTPYSQRVIEQEQQTEAARAQLMTIRKKRFYAIIAVFVVFAIFFGVQIVQSKASLHSVNNQITTKQTKLKQAQSKNSSLKKEVKLLNNDDYLQKVIRSKYYYAKSGETVYSLPTSDSAMSTANSNKNK